MKRQFGSIRKLPSGRFQARYPTASGEVVPAPTTFKTKAEASSYLAEVESDLRRGTHLDHRRSAITFDEWVGLYKTNVPKSATTGARDAAVLRKHFLPKIGRLPLSAITQLQVQQLVNAMGATLEPKTVHTNYGVLRAVLNAAVNDERIVRSPCRGIRLPAVRSKHRTTLTSAELDRLFAAMPDDYGLMVHLAGALGLRWSELIALRVSSFELLARPATVTISEAMPTAGGRPTLGGTKSPSSARTLPLPGYLTKLVAGHMASLGLTAANSSTFVFRAPAGGPLHYSNFRTRVWLPALRRAGLEGISMLSLRRTAMTLWGESHLTPKAIQTLAGHSDPRLSQAIYQQATDSMHRDIADRLERSHSKAGKRIDEEAG